eukprot:m51a1_g11666 hypothetical protein (308) ;mRNA; f:8270-9597
MPIRQPLIPSVQGGHTGSQTSATGSSTALVGGGPRTPCKGTTAAMPPSPSPAQPTATTAPANPAVDVGSCFLAPYQIIKAVETMGVTKASLPISRMFMLGVLSGAYIAMGGTCAIAVGKGLPNSDPGIQKFAFGAVFPVGLMLVIIAGSELITGNFAVLMPALLNGRITWWQALNNFFWVYAGNLAGSVAYAYFWAYRPGLFNKDPWLSGVQGIAELKVSYGFGTAFLSGMGCNWLVCLAVLMATAGKTLACKVAVIWFPIQTFVTIGYEHCVANMFFIPVGILYGANVSWPDFVWPLLLCCPPMRC